MQNKETLLQLVERLRGAGQMDHLSFCNKYGSRPPWDHCNCIASDHNSAVDAAAKALVAGIERMQLETFREQQRAEEDNLLNDLRTGSKT